MPSCEKTVKPQLICPAGNEQKLKYAFAYGADAVYAGPPSISLRANLNQYDLTMLERSIRYAHTAGKKLFVTANIFAHEHDIDEVEKTLLAAAELGPDAFIISDPGLLRLVRRLKITTPVHLSTQANVTNSESVGFWSDLGVKRVILARELGFREIMRIRERCMNVELEIFVHGALCVSYSGRCLLSDLLAGRDANRGECAGTCRWKYYLVEEKRPGDLHPIEEDSKGTYILNSRDLNLLGELDRMKPLRIDGYKIEGRTKNILYVALAARAYRRELDRVYGDGRQDGNDDDSGFLRMTDNHGFTKGFLFRQSGSMQNVHEKDRVKQSVAGFIRDFRENDIHVEIKNPLSRGDVLTAVSPVETFRVKVMELYENGTPIRRAFGSKKQFVRMVTDRRFKDEGWNYGILIRERPPAESSSTSGTNVR